MFFSKKSIAIITGSNASFLAINRKQSFREQDNNQSESELFLSGSRSSISLSELLC